MAAFQRAGYLVRIDRYLTISIAGILVCKIAQAKEFAIHQGLATCRLEVVRFFNCDDLRDA
ncbi:hypothetical protein JF55_22285 [Pseudomonas sp. 1-7]|nr:hypothetical protein JF55_22285 [Pseudomonas sp. 1-7]